MSRPITSKETRRATGLAFLAWTIAVYDFILFGTLLPRIGADFKWDTSTVLTVSTFVSVGTAVVVLLVGPLVDRFGRRKGIVISVGGTAISSAATALTAGAASLIGVRSVSGLGLAEQSINATYLSEIYERTESEFVKKRKGFVYSLVQTGWPVGALLAAAFAGIVGTMFGAENWRMTFILATIPALLVALLCLKLKESPQFLAQREVRRLQRSGLHEEAAVLALREGLDANVGAPIVRIFQGKHLRNTIVLSFAWILNWFGIQTFSVLGTTVLEMGKGITASDALMLVVISNVVAALGYIAHGWAGDRWGRKRAIVVGWILSGASFVAMLSGPSSPEFVLVTYMIGLFFLLGPYAALLFFQAECFDTDCRATGSTFLGAMSQPGAIIAGFILTAIVSAAVPFATAALIVGALGTALSGVVMLFARPISHTQQLDDPETATSAVEPARRTY